MQDKCDIKIRTEIWNNHKLAIACGLVTIPSRRTFDRRLKTIPIDIKQRILTMGHLFVLEGLVDPSITSVDSTAMSNNYFDTTNQTIIVSWHYIIHKQVIDRCFYHHLVYNIIPLYRRHIFTKCSLYGWMQIQPSIAYHIHAFPSIVLDHQVVVSQIVYVECIRSCSWPMNSFFFYDWNYIQFVKILKVIFRIISTIS